MTVTRYNHWGKMLKIKGHRCEIKLLLLLVLTLVDIGGDSGGEEVGVLVVGVADVDQDGCSGCLLRGALVSGQHLQQQHQLNRTYSNNTSSTGTTYSNNTSSTGATYSNNTSSTGATYSNNTSSTGPTATTPAQQEPPTATTPAQQEPPIATTPAQQEPPTATTPA